MLRRVASLSAAAIAGVVGYQWHEAGGYFNYVDEVPVREGSLFELPESWRTRTQQPTGGAADRKEDHEECYELIVPWAAFHPRAHFRLEDALVDFVRAVHSAPAYRIFAGMSSAAAALPPSGGALIEGAEFGPFRVAARRAFGVSLEERSDVLQGRRTTGAPLVQCSTGGKNDAAQHTSSPPDATVVRHRANFSVAAGPSPDHAVLRFGMAGTDVDRSAWHHRVLARLLVAQAAHRLEAQPDDCHAVPSTAAEKKAPRPSQLRGF